MKLTLRIAIVLALALALPGSLTAGEREMDDLRAELEALTEAVSAQLRLLTIYEGMGKDRQAGTTRVRLRELLGEQQALLHRIDAVLALGGLPTPKPPALEPPKRERVVKDARVTDAAANPPNSRPTPEERLGVDGAGRLENPPEDVANLPPHQKVHIGGGAGGPIGKIRTTNRTIDLALEWLRAHQSVEGYWDSDGFGKHCRDGACDGKGGPLYDPGVTGLATLAFLGAGETHKHGRYKRTVKQALTYLKQIQDPEGCFGPRTTNHFIYNHALSALAMSEAYAMTASPLFKQSAQLAMDFIHKARNPYLAWRYGVRPGDNDTSVTGWMVMALASGKQAGLRVDPGAFLGAKAWIEKVTEPKYGRVGYVSRGTGPARAMEMMEKFPSDKSEALTAEAIVARILCGEKVATSEPIAKGVGLILRLPPVWDDSAGTTDMYYWYHATNALCRVGGPSWLSWRPAMEAVLIENQRTEGDMKGSWDPVGPWGRDGGRIYSTALMALTAEIIERGKSR